MRRLVFVLLIAGMAAACGNAQTSMASNDTSTLTEKPAKKMSKKETAITFVQAVTSQKADKVRELVNEDYIQHNPFLPTGREPFIGLFPVLAENGTSAEAVRVIEDGNYVIIHHLWKGAKPFGADEMVSFDILRFDENGKIAEHWDAMMPNAPANGSGRTLLDGPTEIEDLSATAENKETILSLMDDVLFGKNPSNVTEYISTEMYHQHNPQITDGLEGLQAAFQYLAEQDDMFQYTKKHAVFAEGNFVLTVNEGIWHGKGHVFYDLFRLQDGKAVEHWDVIQEIPTEGMANENGMFGFEG